MIFLYIAKIKFKKVIDLLKYSIENYYLKSMEYREVYTREGKPTGKIVEKHIKNNSGDYFRHVIIIMKTSDSPLPGKGEGQYIMQQRSLKSKHYAGKWDMTGGGVIAGETIEDAAIREVKEELGIELNKNNLVLSYEYIIDWDDGTGLIISMFACRINVPVDGFSFDKCEVNNVKIAPFNEFYNNVMDHNCDSVGIGLKKIENTI